MCAFCFSLACVKQQQKKNGKASENCQYRRARVFEIEEIIACVHSVFAWLFVKKKKKEEKEKSGNVSENCQYRRALVFVQFIPHHCALQFF